ncbi:MAG: hypothetical protein HC893_00335 [Chloroflexaceae bacterium]|nr:hypothetical protein [Chloroflexaceae bacterium]
MLIDFTLSQALKHNVSAQALDQMITGISEATGLYDSTSAALIGDAFSEIQRWAERGGQSTSTVLANLHALPSAASEARLQQERLTDAMVENAVSTYAVSGNLEAYRQQLQQIPTNVATQMGLAVSGYDDHALVVKHQEHLDALQTAQAEHNQAMVELQGQRNKDAAEARQEMLASLDTEEEIQKRRQDILDRYLKQADELKLDYAQDIGQTLFEKGLNQADVTAFLQQQLPSALAEVEDINQKLQTALEAGVDPEAAAVQWAYAMNASQYAQLTGKTGGDAMRSVETMMDDIETATTTRIDAMQEAWSAYQDTLTEDIPQWYEDSKTQILTSHAQQVAELKSQLKDLTETERNALQDITVSEGQWLFRRNLDAQRELQDLVRSGKTGSEFYSRYAQLTDEMGSDRVLSLERREKQTVGIVTGEQPAATYRPTIVVDVHIGNEKFKHYIENVSYRVLEDDYEQSVRNGGLRRR